MTVSSRARGWQTSVLTLVTVALVAGCAGGSGADVPGKTVDPCAPTESPSGQLPPTESSAGWDLRFTDDFDRCELGSDWSAYAGQPGGNPNSRWDESMVRMSYGVLELRSQQTDGQWITGGVSNYPITQQYGKWLVRMRADKSADISYHMLLWPQDEIWPPEIDFAESVSGDRSEMSAFLHWVDAEGGQAKTNAETTGDFSQWHTVGVEWGPGIIRYTLDGNVWAEAHSETMVPNVPMWLALQAEAGACERRVDWGMTPCTGVGDLHPQAPTVEIDWVAVYEADLPALDQMDRAGEFAPQDTAEQLTDGGAQR